MSERAAAAPPVRPEFTPTSIVMRSKVILHRRASNSCKAAHCSIVSCWQIPLMVAQVAEATNLRHINVGDWVKEQDLHSGYDAEFDSYIIDEDKVARLCLLPTITATQPPHVPTSVFLLIVYCLQNETA